VIRIKLENSKMRQGEPVYWEKLKAGHTFPIINAFCDKLTDGAHGIFLHIEGENCADEIERITRDKITS